MRALPRMVGGVLAVLAVLVAREALTVELQLVVQWLDSPLYVTAPPDGSGRLVIVEKPGRIKVLQPGGGAPTVFLGARGRPEPGAPGALEDPPAVVASPDDVDLLARAVPDVAREALAGVAVEGEPEGVGAGPGGGPHVRAFTAADAALPPSFTAY